MMVNNYDNFFLLIKLVSLNLISRYFQLQPGVTYNTMTKVRQLNVYVSIHHSTLINRKLETMFVFFFFSFSFLNKYLCGFDMFLFFLCLLILSHLTIECFSFFFCIFKEYITFRILYCLSQYTNLYMNPT